MEQQIQGKFIRVAKSPARNMIKVFVDGKEQWADCPQNVKGFASRFQERQDVVLTASLINNRYNVSRIEPVGGANQNSYQPPVQNTSSHPVPAQTYSPPPQVQSSYQNYNNSNYQKPKTPEESERVTRLSVLSSVCNAISSVPGQVDVNAIWDVVEAGYDRLLAKVKR